MSKSKKILFVAAILLPLLTLTACSKVSLTGTTNAPAGSEAGGPGGDGGTPPTGTPPTDGGAPTGGSGGPSGAPAQ